MLYPVICVLVYNSGGRVYYSFTHRDAYDIQTQPTFSSDVTSDYLAAKLNAAGWRVQNRRLATIFSFANAPFQFYSELQNGQCSDSIPGLDVQSLPQLEKRFNQRFSLNKTVFTDWGSRNDSAVNITEFHVVVVSADPLVVFSSQNLSRGVIQAFRRAILIGHAAVLAGSGRQYCAFALLNIKMSGEMIYNISEIGAAAVGVDADRYMDALDLVGVEYLATEQVLGPSNVEEFQENKVSLQQLMSNKTIDLTQLTDYEIRIMLRIIRIKNQKQRTWNMIIPYGDQSLFFQQTRYNQMLHKLLVIMK